MRAYVVVLETPSLTSVMNDGTSSCEGLPSGKEITIAVRSKLKLDDVKVGGKKKTEWKRQVSKVELEAR